MAIGQQQQRQHDDQPDVALLELVARLLPADRIAAEGEDDPAEVGRRHRDEADDAQRGEDHAHLQQELGRGNDCSAVRRTAMRLGNAVAPTP